MAHARPYGDQDFRMPIGNTRMIVARVTNRHGAPIDMDGAYVKWALLRDVNGEDKLIVKETGGMGITLGASHFVVVLEPEDTMDLEPGRYYHEGFMELDGDYSTACRGRVTLEPVALKKEV